MPTRPNILWVCTDHQRYDTIARLGNPNIQTPVLDRLVDGGVAFTRAYTQSPVCTPSRASFLTGRYPAAHQVLRNGNAYFPSQEVLVTKLLARAGYDCGMAGKFHLSCAQPTEARLDDGFRVFHWSHHPYPNLSNHAYTDWLRAEKRVDPRELYASIRSYCGPGVPTELHQTTWCTEMAIRFITQRRDGPWLFNINCFDPHPPCDPPAEYLERYDSGSLPHALFRDSDSVRQEKFRRIQQHSPQVGNPLGEGCGEEDVPWERMAIQPPRDYDSRILRAGYYGMITLIDAQLGRIVDVLAETGQLENTLIIFHSDHGSLMGDHGLMYLGCRFYEGLVRVPLIFSWPKACQKGLVSDALVELVDIAPTLLDVAGLAPTPAMQGKPLTGILKGNADPSFHKPHVVCEYHDSLGTTPVREASHGSMYCDGRHKIAVYHGTDLGELYDLQADPEEFDDLWDDPASRELRADLLRRHFDAMMATVGAGVPRAAAY